jgi:prephenate dehydrogenase
MPLVAILGTGLIGASIGIGLRQAGWRVAGWDPDEEALDGADAVGALDRVATRADVLAGADLVVLAGPPAAIEAELAIIETSALVTDVAGVKEPMVRAGTRLARFVGGHPMAGRETSGPAGASGGLFRGATWVLTTDGVRSEDMEQMADVVLALGGVPVHMGAVEHDEAVAAISHLPQVVAWALVNQVARNQSALDLAAGGFRDLTRIALSSAAWWPEVLTENRRALSSLVRRLGSDLTDWADHIDGGENEQLGAEMLSARAARASLTAPVASIGVILEDRPGEIARVGHALELSGVDLRDLQLRHATHGGGGVLTLSVRSIEVDLLRQTLVAEGFRLL